LLKLNVPPFKVTGDAPRRLAFFPVAELLSQVSVPPEFTKNPEAPSTAPLVPVRLSVPAPTTNAPEAELLAERFSVPFPVLVIP